MCNKKPLKAFRRNIGKLTKNRADVTGGLPKRTEKGHKRTKRFRKEKMMNEKDTKSVSNLSLFWSSSRLPFIFPFWLFFGRPRVSPGRFLMSPFEPASNLTPALPPVFPGSVVALLFVSCLFLFEFSSRFLFLLFFLFGSSSRAADLFGSSSETRRSRRKDFW